MEPPVRHRLERGQRVPFGNAVWTYNDYRSRYPKTDDDGYRHYGAVTAERQPKASYDLFAAEFSPALIRDGKVVMDRSAGGNVVASASIHVRKDFPSYPLRDYTVRCQVLDGAGEVLTMRTMALPLLRPGDHYTLNTTFKLASAARPAIVRIEVVRPTGFVTATQDLNIAP